MPAAWTDLSGNGPQQVYVYLAHHSTNDGGNYTTWAWEVQFRNWGGLQWMSDAVHYWSVSGPISHGGWFGIPSSWAGANIIHTLGSGTFNLGHDGNGYLGAFNLTGAIDTAHSGIGDGAATVSSGTPPRIPKPPLAPTSRSHSDVTAEGARISWGASSDARGSAINLYQVQIGKGQSGGEITSQVTAPGFGPSTRSFVWDGGEPNTTYYYRVRARNDSAGRWGNWTTIASFKTLSGLYVSNGSSWIAQPLRVSTGSAWADIYPQISDGDSWEDPIEV